MSMFDWVDVDKSLLPDDVKFFGEKEWQTKDFESHLETYEIRADGQLVFYEKIREVEKSSKAIFGFYLKVTQENVIEMDYTGEVVFYKLDQKTMKLYDLVATFENGKLTKPIEIKCIS